MLCSQNVKGVRVAKKGDFAQLGGCISENKRGRKLRSAPFNRSHQNVYACQFLYKSVSTTLCKDNINTKMTL